MSVVAKAEPKMIRGYYNFRETGWLEDLGGGLFRIANIPVFDNKWLLDDVVTMKGKGHHSLPVVGKLVKRVFGGKSALYYSKVPQFHKLCKALKKVGCKVEGMVSPGDGDGIMFAVYPKGVDPRAIAKKLGAPQEVRRAKKA
jgi:hypothetical protein